jgi:GT2 family glycosyltransferase
VTVAPVDLVGLDGIVVHVVDTDGDERVRATVRVVREVLTAGGARCVDLAPRGLRRRHRSAERAFEATPQPLIEAWRLARRLEGVAGPGDVLLVTDRNGVGGILAVEEAMRPPEERRRVVVTAADSTALEYLAVAGTIDGAAGDDVYRIDWELTGYRFAAAVVSTSRSAAAWLRRLGIGSVVVDTAGSPGLSRAPAAVPATVWLPEPVSRISRTPDVLRAVGSVPALRRVVVSDVDAADRIWTGTTWQAVAGVRDAVSVPVVRSGTAPGEPHAVVLGDPFAQPPEEVVAAWAAGGVVYPAKGSAAALRMPGTVTWEGEDGLAAILTGEPPSKVAGAAVQERASVRLLERVEPEPGRAREVTVGIPVFRDVRFLGECVQSVVGQTQPPVEVVIVDDGSNSEEVDAALEEQAGRYPGLVRVLRQSNRGVCVARNTIIETMRGDALVLVDSDDVLDPAFIERCAGALRANPDLDAVATWTRFFGGYEGIEAKPPFDVRVGMRENPIVSTCVLVDAAVFDRGVRFTPDLAFVYCEDWDVWAQMAARGMRFGLVPVALAHHRVHEHSGGFRRTELALEIGKARATRRLRGVSPSGAASPEG